MADKAFRPARLRLDFERRSVSGRRARRPRYEELIDKIGFTKVNPKLKE
jgi:hypothetical protein